MLHLATTAQQGVAAQIQKGIGKAQLENFYKQKIPKVKIFLCGTLPEPVKLATTLLIY